MLCFVGWFDPVHSGSTSYWLCWQFRCPDDGSTPLICPTALPMRWKCLMASWIKLALPQMVCGLMFAVSSVLHLQASIIACVFFTPLWKALTSMLTHLTMNIVYQRKEVLPNVQTFTLPTEHRRDQGDWPALTRLSLTVQRSCCQYSKQHERLSTSAYGPASVDTNPSGVWHYSRIFLLSVRERAWWGWNCIRGVGVACKSRYQFQSGYHCQLMIFAAALTVLLAEFMDWWANSSSYNTILLGDVKNDSTNNP